MPGMNSDPEARIEYLETLVAALRAGLQDAWAAIKALRQLLALAARASGAPQADPTGTALGQTVGSIPAVSGSTLGSGNVALYDPTAFPTLTLLGGYGAAYNSTATAVGASKVVQLKKIGGDWFVDVESC